MKQTTYLATLLNCSRSPGSAHRSVSDRQIGIGRVDQRRAGRTKDGGRMQVVGVVEDGKYTANLAEDPQNAMFVPILQNPVLTPGWSCAPLATWGKLVLLFGSAFYRSTRWSCCAKSERRRLASFKSASGDRSSSIALLCCAVYFGSTVYVTLVEHPAPPACATEVHGRSNFASSWGLVLRKLLILVWNMTGIRLFLWGPPCPSDRPGPLTRIHLQVTLCHPLRTVQSTTRRSTKKSPQLKIRTLKN
jgi:hypothetical protein